MEEDGVEEDSERCAINAAAATQVNNKAVHSRARIRDLDGRQASGSVSHGRRQDHENNRRRRRSIPGNESSTDHERYEHDAKRQMPTRALAAEQQEPHAERKSGTTVTTCACTTNGASISGAIVIRASNRATGNAVRCSQSNVPARVARGCDPDGDDFANINSATLWQSLENRR